MPPPVSPLHRPPVPTVRRWNWDRNDPHGFIRMALVFVGAFVGAFVVWPMVRPYVIPDQHYAAGDAPQVPIHGRRQHDR